MNLARRTRPGLLVALAVIGGVVAWSVETWLVSTGRAVMAPPFTMPVTLVLIAVALLWAAWPIRAYTRRLWREHRDAETRRVQQERGSGAAGEASATEPVDRSVGRRVDPQYAFRVLALARAGGLAAALLAGASSGVLVFALTRTVPPEQAIWDSVLSLVGSLVLFVVALIAESWCRIPPGGDAAQASQDAVAA